MKKLAQALILALVVAAPAAITAPQVQAKTVTSRQQLAANTSGNKVMKKHLHRSARRAMHRTTK